MPMVMMVTAMPNRTTPMATVQASRSVGIGFSSLRTTGAGGSRRIRDGRGSAALRPVVSGLLTLPVYTRRLTGGLPAAHGTSRSESAR
jgi:hypothetical protein